MMMMYARLCFYVCREVKGTATVVSPFWGWNLQVSANASLAGTTINNVDAVLNKSFMV